MNKNEVDLSSIILDQKQRVSMATNDYGIRIICNIHTTLAYYY